MHGKYSIKIWVGLHHGMERKNKGDFYPQTGTDHPVFEMDCNSFEEAVKHGHSIAKGILTDERVHNVEIEGVTRVPY